MTWIIPHLKIQNANAFSSPYSVGFPAVTAWMGMAHKLQREMQNKGFSDFEVKGVGICSHDFHLHTHKGPSDYVASIVGTANPLDAKGGRPSFIEEPRCNLTASLILELEDSYYSQKAELAIILQEIVLSRLKAASGDIVECDTPFFLGDKPLHRAIQPGFVLLDRREWLAETMEEENLDAVDAVLEWLKVRSYWEKEGENIVWRRSKKGHEEIEDIETAWLVPISVGYQGITPLARAKGLRNSGYLHRFAESVVTLAEFRSVYRVDLEDIFWRYAVDLNKSLYLCQQE